MGHFNPLYPHIYTTASLISHFKYSHFLSAPRPKLRMYFSFSQESRMPLSSQLPVQEIQLQAKTLGNYLNIYQPLHYHRNTDTGTNLGPSNDVLRS
jgi:hypothetical protein